MKLLTDELRARLPPLDSHKAEADPFVYAKFFLPGTGRTWYVIEGQEQEGDFLFFGFIGGESEFGYFRLSELESVRSPMDGLPVERDLAFTEGRLTDVVPAPDF